MAGGSVFFSFRMILKDSSSAAQQEAGDNDGEQTAGKRPHDNPGVKLKADDKDKHENDGHSALPEDAERKRAEEQTNDKGNDENREPGCRGSANPGQSGRERGNDCIDDRSITGLWDTLV